MTRLVIEGAAIATVDRAGTEHACGHLITEGGRIVAVGAGPAPDGTAGPDERRVDGSGCLLTPGLVNTHHHLYQWVTRGYAQQCTLFEWLTGLYPVWARLTEPAAGAAAAAGLAWLALSGATTTTDHHYIFPRGAGDLLGSTVEAARRIGLRFHPCRGSMDLGRAAGGLPPDEIVEDLDTILDQTADAVHRFHDPTPDAMVRIAVAPCSPFSVSSELLTRSAALARQLGVRLHTHLAETLDEEEFCRDRHGCTPVEYLDRLDWLGPDVWLAHTVHLAPAAVNRLGETGTGVAHCPSSNARLGAGIAPVRALLDAGAPVGLGVDGAASQEAGRMVDELRQSLYLARLRAGPRALTAREALWMATVGGARCLGRADEIGSLEPGKLADLALWRLDGIAHVGIDDPVAALVFGSAPPLRLLVVGGRVVVEDGVLQTEDERSLARELSRASQEMRR